MRQGPPAAALAFELWTSAIAGGALLVAVPLALLAVALALLFLLAGAALTLPIAVHFAGLASALALLLLLALAILLLVGLAVLAAALLLLPVFVHGSTPLIPQGRGHLGVTCWKATLSGDRGGPVMPRGRPNRRCISR
jgi:hypothetical protein